MNKVRDTVLFIGEIAATAATVYMVWRVFAGPDGTKLLHMKIAKAAENFSQHQAESWAHMADTCSTLYRKSTNISV
jgi:hypothetical protein